MTREEGAKYNSSKSTALLGSEPNSNLSLLLTQEGFLRSSLVRSDAISRSLVAYIGQSMPLDLNIFGKYATLPLVLTFPLSYYVEIVGKAALSSRRTGQAYITASTLRIFRIVRRLTNFIHRK